MSEQTSNMAHEARLKQSQIKQESEKSKIKLITQKELIKGSITRLKRDIRNLHWSEENGLSSQKLLPAIDESYDKLGVELTNLVNEWYNFITLTVISKEPQPQSTEERDILKKEIDEEMRMIDEYKNMVDEIKFENLDIFSKIEMKSKFCEQSQTLIKENQLKPELRPSPLTINSSFTDVKDFLQNFLKYIKSGEQTSGLNGLVFEIASKNLDNFWMTLLNGWHFNETTSLKEFSFMVNTIAKDRFSINTIRKEMLDLKQDKNENPTEYLNKIQQLMGISDWYNISATEATCLIFQIGVKCAKSRKICSDFMKQFPEGDIHKLKDQLKVVDALKSKGSKENCLTCGKQGHLKINCWGKCPACGGFGHRAGDCQLSPEKVRAREKRKKRRIRNRINKRIKSKMKSDTNPPEDQTNSNYWADSLSDGETVVDLDTTQESLEESTDEEGEAEDVKTVKEVMGDVSVSDIIAAIERIKSAKDNDNSANGLVSNNMDFRDARQERFLFDTGATACIMGEKIAQDNKIKIKRLAKPKNIHEASGAKLDIIGSATLFVKLESIGKTKKLTCFVLRGHSVDREILISIKMLRKWDLVHPTFPHETIKSYVKRQIKIRKVASIFDKSPVPSKVRVSEVPTECELLRKKILAVPEDWMR